MKINHLFLFVCLSYINNTTAQFVSNPLESQFITKDIKNFWNAFDSLEAGYKGNPFDKFYIKSGSPGIQAFMNNRIESSESLLNKVKERKEDYLKARENSLRMLNNEKQCRSTFMALKYLYPQAVFPPVYFVIGRFNSGGHSDTKGLIIGAEMVQSESVPYIVAHELIHYQQDSLTKENLFLLAACINEGSADFIGELISGGGPNRETYKYGNAHEKKLWLEFKKIMNDREDSHDWMYNYKPKNGYPPDLGYWIGYRITQSYYNKAKNKQKAVHEILHIKDYRKFLEQSGYTKWART